MTALPARGESGGVSSLGSDAGRWSCCPGRGDSASTARTDPPSEVPLDPTEDPVARTSVVNLDSVERVSIGTLVERLGRLSDDRMRHVCDALAIAVACQG
jgi:mRNA-degrading endonuclease toxin of MazEF toxin-antitoxin module